MIIQKPENNIFLTNSLLQCVYITQNIINADLWFYLNISKRRVTLIDV